MSKHTDQKKPAPATNATPAADVVTSPVITAAAPEGHATEVSVAAKEIETATIGTAIAVSAPVPSDPVAAALALRVPHKLEELLTLERPTTVTMFTAMSKLPSEQQAQLKLLAKRSNPKKPGIHDDRRGFTPTELRLYQGTGSDPLLPPDMVPGHFYTGESKAIKPPTKMAVLGGWVGRTLWPPKSAPGGGGDAKTSKAPLCVSYDRKIGSKYGECHTCPFENKPYNQDGCTREVGLFLIDEGLTNIFELRLSKTSASAGENLLKVLSKGDAPWGWWVTVGVEERKEVKEGKNARWFVWSLKKSTEVVSPALNDIFTQFSQLLDLDVFYPRLADVYERKETSGQSGAGPKGDTADMNQLTGGAPDYSDESGPSV